MKTLAENNKEKIVVLGPYHHCLTHTEAGTVSSFFKMWLLDEKPHKSNL